MSRPRQYDGRTATSIRLTPDTHARLTNAAKERDLSVNWMVQRAVDYYLDRLIPVDQITLVRPSGEPTP